MTTALAVAVTAVFEGVVAIAAYQSGKRHGRVTLPAELVRELRGHKVQCIGEPVQRVDLEIALLCDTERPRARATGLPS